MPMTRLQERARKKYVTVKEFQEQYSLSRAQAYKILARTEMEETKIRVGEKGIRIDLDRAFEIMQQIF
jgi:predicted DNA-binding ArsR family transcriptional regulator